MKTVAIIPVKSFSRAKSRLNLSSEKTEELCKIMLNEVLQTVFNSKNIDQTIIVSRDQSAFDIGKKFDVIEIFDDSESGVNNAIALADNFISDEFDTSVIFPQDVPFFNDSDVNMLFSFLRKKNSIIITPSRHFNGTNSLIRNPYGVITTRYDEGTYKSHVEQAKLNKIDFSLVLIKRLMLDIDTYDDIMLAMKYNEKPNLCQKILELLD